MMSHITIITLGDKIQRFWYLDHIRMTKQDASLPCVGDVIQHGFLSLYITHIGFDTESYPVWVGRLFGAPLDKYGLKQEEIVAWGRKGLARSLPAYKDGNYYSFTTDKSYLWT